MKAPDRHEENEELCLPQSTEASPNKNFPATTKGFVPHVQIPQTDTTPGGDETAAPTATYSASQMPGLLGEASHGNIEPLYHTHLDKVTLALLMVFMTSMWYEAKAKSKFLDKTAQWTIQTLFNITPRTAHVLFEAARGLLQQCLADVKHGVPPSLSEIEVKKRRTRKATSGTENESDDSRHGSNSHVEWKR